MSSQLFESLVYIKCIMRFLDEQLVREAISGARSLRMDILNNDHDNYELNQGVLYEY